MSRRRKPTRAKKQAATPVRAALRSDSPLQARVQHALGAVEDAHRSYIAQAIRADFQDSLELDEAMRAGREGDNRWDYLLGHGPSQLVVAIEPHSAKEDQITTVIKKKKAALLQLRSHLADGARIQHWFWVASNKVHFADTERARRRLDQYGIQFVGKQLLSKHLP